MVWTHPAYRRTVHDLRDRSSRREFGWPTWVTYRYDALGNRVEQSSAAGITRCVNLGANVIAEYDGSNTLRASYVTTMGSDNLPGIPLETNEGGTATYPLLDATGSVTGTTNASGALTSFSYTAYGTPVGASSGTYAYGTYGYDSATGLYYARARYYDPGSGRFLSEDPISNVNLRNYCGDQPLSGSDPTGREELEEYATTTAQRTRAATQGVGNLPERVFLTEERLNGHIEELHAWGQGVEGKSEFYPGRTIQADIMEALKAPDANYSYGGGGNILIQYAFDGEIGVTDFGSMSCFIQVVINTTGKVLTAVVL